MAEIIAIASGKGGVGKSFFSSSLALSLRKKGFSVLLVDADLGGANLHNFIGLKVPGVGVYNFLKEKIDIEDVIIKSPAGIDFIGGSGDILGMAHITKFEKDKIINRLKTMHYHFVVMDLGAGTSFNMVDFFNMADKRITLMNSEPTSIENAYGFLKVAVYRYIERMLARDDAFADVCAKLRSKSMNFPSVEAIRAVVRTMDASALKDIDTFIEGFRSGMVLNMVKTRKEMNVFYGFESVVKKYLSIRVEKLGFLPYDIEVSEHIKSLQPYYLAKPDSPIAGCVDDVREEVLRKL